MLPKFLTTIFGSRNERLLKGYRRSVERINALEPQFERLDDAALRAKTDEFKKRLAEGAEFPGLAPARRRIVENELRDFRLSGAADPTHARGLRTRPVPASGEKISRSARTSPGSAA